MYVSKCVYMTITLLLGEMGCYDIYIYTSWLYEQGSPVAVPSMYRRVTLKSNS